ncbi:MAG: hypothetical protein Fur0018_15180 [Anaerolineales bacterium]
MLSGDGMRYLQAENARLRDENERLMDENRRLRRAIHALNYLRGSLPEITPQVDALNLVYALLEVALQAVDSEDGSLLLLDEASQELYFAAVLGRAADALCGHRIPMDEGVAGWCVVNRTHRLVQDAHLDPYFSSNTDRMLHFETHSLIAVPLIWYERVFGALEVVNTRSGAPFTEEDLDIMSLVAHLIVQALAQAEGVPRV